MNYWRQKILIILMNVINCLMVVINLNLFEFCSIGCKFEKGTCLKHEGVVNRARCMPQNCNIVATMSSDHNAYIYDFAHQQDFKTCKF